MQQTLGTFAILDYLRKACRFRRIFLVYLKCRYNISVESELVDSGPERSHYQYQGLILPAKLIDVF